MTRIGWEFPSEEELALVGQEGVVGPDPGTLGLFVWVHLDTKPEWWNGEDGLPLMPDEVELVK